MKMKCGVCRYPNENRVEYFQTPQYFPYKPRPIKITKESIAIHEAVKKHYTMIRVPGVTPDEICFRAVEIERSPQEQAFSDAMLGSIREEMTDDLKDLASRFGAMKMYKDLGINDEPFTGLTRWKDGDLSRRYHMRVFDPVI